MTTRVLIPIIRQTLPTVIAQQIVGTQPMMGLYFDVVYNYHTHPHYKFSRKWFEGEIKYSTEIAKVVTAAEAWCVDIFGPHPINPDAWCRWYRYSTRKFYFRDEKDYLLFTMRWV